MFRIQEVNSVPMSSNSHPNFETGTPTQTPWLGVPLTTSPPGSMSRLMAILEQRREGHQNRPPRVKPNITCFECGQVEDPEKADSWVRFKTEFIFERLSNSWGGSFYRVHPEFQITKSPKFPVYKCKSCMLNVKFDEIRCIKCATCDAEFTQIYGLTQARHCASVLIDKRLTCHYGSDKDFLEFEWVGDCECVSSSKKSAAGETVIDPICDTCIDGWLDKGYIRENGGYTWYDPFQKKEIRDVEVEEGNLIAGDGM